MYKLIALDMDGTLLNSKKQISKENKEAIKKAKSKGVKVVLASGRPLNGIKDYLEELNLVEDEDFVVSFNGALVQKTKSNEILCNKTLTHEDLYFLYDLSKKLKVNIHALTPNECITPLKTKYSFVESEMNHIPLLEVDFSNLPKDTEIVKVMFVDEPHILDDVIKNLPKEVSDRYTVVRSAKYFLEFLNKEVNKGEGVKLLADLLNIKPEEVICVGDAGNDLHMVNFAGLGVAMENAFDELKKEADFVTLSNDNNGVAHVINKFILSQN